MTSPTNFAQNVLATTVKEYEAIRDSSKKNDSFVASVEHLGRKWVVARLNFVVPALAGVIGTVNGVVSAVFHSLNALFVGQFFTDEKSRTQAAEKWKDLGDNLFVVAKSLVGVACPHLLAEKASKPADAAAAVAADAVAADADAAVDNS